MRVWGVGLPEVLSDHLARASERDAYRKAVALNFPPAAMEMLRSTGSR